MVARYNIYHEYDLMLMQLNGDANVGDIVRLMQTIWSDDDYDPTRPLILDIRELKLHVISKELRGLGKIINNSDKRFRGKAIVLVENPVLTAAVTFIYRVTTFQKNKVCYITPKAAFQNLKLPESLLDDLAQKEALVF